MSRYFAETHEWLEELTDGRVRLGLTNYAQEQLGDIVFLNLPEEGEVYDAEDVIGDVESIKSVSDIVIPVGGTIVEINEDLLDSPELINEAADETWLVILEDVEGLEDLMSEEEYNEYIENQN